MRAHAAQLGHGSYFRRFLELKYEFPRPERAFLAQQCLAAIPLSAYDITLQSKFIRAATSLLACVTHGGTWAIQCQT